MVHDLSTQEGRNKYVIAMSRRNKYVIPMSSKDDVFDKALNISKEDFILWDTVNNKPLEKHWDIVYHYTSIVEIINDGGFRLTEGQELRCVAELSLKWQRIISAEIEKCK